MSQFCDYDAAILLIILGAFIIILPSNITLSPLTYHLWRVLVSIINLSVVIISSYATGQNEMESLTLR